MGSWSVAGALAFIKSIWTIPFSVQTAQLIVIVIFTTASSMGHVQTKRTTLVITHECSCPLEATVL